jgi:hypothetical protein
VHSVLTQEVSVENSEELSVHAVCETVASGQLPVLG